MSVENPATIGGDPSLAPLPGGEVRRGMGWAGHLRATGLLAIPMIGAQLAQMAMNVSDTVMVGWLGASELAAAVLATQAFFIVFIFGSGFAQAAMPLAASAEGQDDTRGVRRAIRMSLWVVLAYAAAMMLPLWHTEAILLALDQEPGLAALAGRYMHIAQWALFPALTVMVLRSFLSVVDRAYVMMAIILVGLVLNVALNAVFIFGALGMPALGIVGAAVATLGSNCVMASMLVAYSGRAPELKGYEMWVRFWRPDWPALLQIVRLGWPIGATIIAEVGLFAASSVMMGWLGTVALAAHGIAVQLASIAFMVPLGIASAVTVRAGVAYGSRDGTGLKRAAETALLIAAVFGGLAALSFWIWPTVFIGLYLDEHNAQAPLVLAYGVPLLVVAAAFQVVDGLQAVAAGILRGLQDTRRPMVIALFSYWFVGLPISYVLGIVMGLGGVGIWWGLAAGLAAAALLLNLRYLRRERFLGLRSG